MATQKALRKRQERQAQDIAERLDAIAAKVDQVLALLKKAAASKSSK